MKTITIDFKVGIVSIVLLFSSFGVKSQNPTNNGFENGSDGWTLTTAGVYTPSVVSTEPRTGSSHLQINYSAKNTSTITSTVSSAVSILTGQYFYIIGWAKKAGANGTFSFGMSGAISNSPSANIALTNAYARYYRKSSSTSTSDGTCQIKVSTQSLGVGDMYFDDFVAYASTNTSVDLAKPVAATEFTLTGNSLSWVEGTDANTGVQETYILRTTNASATAPVLSDQVAYAATNTIDDWTVIGTVNVGTTTYTDISGGSSYYYAVVHRDLAYNNSEAVVTNGVTTGVNTASKQKAQVVVNAQNEIVITAPEKSNYAIYNALGQLIAAGKIINHLPLTIDNSKGVYVVKVNDKSTRVIVK